MIYSTFLTNSQGEADGLAINYDVAVIDVPPRLVTGAGLGDFVALKGQGVTDETVSTELANGHTDETSVTDVVD